MCVKFSFSFNFSVHKNLLPKTTDFYFKNFNKYRVSNKVQLQSIDGISPTFFFYYFFTLLSCFFCSKCEIHYFIFAYSFFFSIFFIGGNEKRFSCFFCMIFSRIYSAFAAISSVVFHLLFFLTPASKFLGRKFKIQRLF